MTHGPLHWIGKLDPEESLTGTQEAPLFHPPDEWKSPLSDSWGDLVVDIFRLALGICTDTVFTRASNGYQHTAGSEGYVPDIVKTTVLAIAGQTHVFTPEIHYLALWLLAVRFWTRCHEPITGKSFATLWLVSLSISLNHLCDMNKPSHGWWISIAPPTVVPSSLAEFQRTRIYFLQTVGLTIPHVTLETLKGFKKTFIGKCPHVITGVSRILSVLPRMRTEDELPLVDVVDSEPSDAVSPT